MLQWLRARDTGETGRRWVSAIGLAEGLLTGLVVVSGLTAV